MMEEDNSKVLIVDTHEYFTDGVRTIAASDPYCVVVVVYDNSGNVQALSVSTTPDVIIMES